MNILTLFSHANASDLVFTLGHTLWQGALIGLALAGLLRWIPARRTDLRYGLSCAALALVVVGAGVTAGVLRLGAEEPAVATSESPGGGWTLARSSYESRALRIDSESGDEMSGASSTSHVASSERSDLPNGSDDTTAAEEAGADYTMGAASMDRAMVASAPPTNDDQTVGAPLRWLRRATPMLLALWLVGVALMMARLFRALAFSRQVRRQCVPVRDTALLVELEDLRRRMGLWRPVQIMTGSLPSGPAVVGFFRASLLVPTSMATGLSPEALRLILAHELAHIRRWDYLVNAVQMLVEAALFFNPAVWWISRRIRIEREACCDALAIAATGAAQVHLARALADAAERWIAPAPGWAPAFAGSPDGDSLRERVLRLVTPGYRPSLRLPWPTLVLLAVIGAAGFYGIGRGGILAVQATANLLSPQERQAQLQQARETHGFDESDRNAYMTGREDMPMARVAGKIVMPDGSAPEKDLIDRMHIISHHGVGTIHSGGRVEEGRRFESDVTAGVIYLSIAPTETTAYTRVGPFTLAPGEALDDLVIQLSEGYDAEIVLRLPDGRPVAGAEIRSTVWIRDSSGGSGTQYAEPQVTDAEGRTTLAQYMGTPLDLEARHPSIQHAYRKDEVLLKDEPLVWDVLPARPCTGVVVDSATSAPIAGAEFFLINSEPDGAPTSTNWIPDLKDAYDKTDADGGFILPGLRPEGGYLFAVRAPGRRLTLFRDAAEGREGLRVVMKPAMVLSGTVIWPEDLPEDERKISYGFTYDMAPHHQYSGGGKAIAVRHEGAVSHFEITDLFESEVTVTIADRQFRYNMTDSLEDMEYNLADMSQSGAWRPVRIRFDIPPDAPSPTGKLRVHSWPEDASMPYTYDWLEIGEDGTARWDVPAPGRISIQARSVTGYWFRDHRVDVELEDGELDVLIPAHPAGAIYGAVFEANGAPAHERVHFLLVTEKRPEAMEGTFLDVSVDNSQRGDNKFYAGPLPFGGDYHITARRGNTIVAGEKAAIGPDNPIVEQDLVLPEGIAMAGRVTDVEGGPLVGVEVKFEAKLATHTFGLETVQTDRDGRFVFQKVNPDWPGQYVVDVQSARDWVPMRKVLEAARPDLGTWKLSRGVSMEGQVVEDESGLPIPGARVYAQRPYDQRPADSDEPWRFKAETLTDYEGRFRLSNLPADSEFMIGTEDSQSVWDNGRQATFRPGDEAPVVVRVTLPAWSALRPAPAPDGTNNGNGTDGAQP